MIHGSLEAWFQPRSRSENKEMILSSNVSEVFTPNLSSHRSPTSVSRSRAIRIARASVGSVVFDVKFHVKYRDTEGGALAFGGHHLAIKSHSQTIVGGNNWGGIKEETRMGRIMWGDAVLLLSWSN